MAKPQKPPPHPVTEHLKAERIRGAPPRDADWRISGVQIAASAVTLTLTTAKTARGLTQQELELAAALEKVA